MKGSISSGTAVTSTTSGRRQPIRQTRTNPVRSSTTSTRQLGAQSSVGAGLENEQDDSTAPGFFPAITHFTNSISAFPQEIIKHFTLLKEVDAKAYGPDEALAVLVQAALNLPPSPRKQAISTDQPEGAAAASSATGNHISNGSLLPGDLPASRASQADTSPASQPQPADDELTLQRRYIFHHLRTVLVEMLMTLEEKNHVISTANEAVNKQLARLHSSFPYVELEFSEEARLGSLTHWANPKPLVDKPSITTTNERSRREPRNYQDIMAATNPTAAQSTMSQEEQAAASRSESRREAMLAKKNRLQRGDSEFDDGRGRIGSAQPIIGGNAAKRPHGNTKVRKGADVGLSVNGSVVGLGITNGNTNPVINPPSKRRKTEKAPTNASNGPVALERSMSGVTNGIVGSKVSAGSPRETPGTESGIKRARGGGAAIGRTRKRNNTVNSTAKNSPSLASSPVQNTFVMAKDAHRSSPAPRPQFSRARQSSTNSALPDGQITNARHRPSSSSSNRPNTSNGISAVTTDANSVAVFTGRSIPDVKSTMKDTLNSKGEHMIEDAAIDSKDSEFKGALVVSSTKANNTQGVKKEDVDSNGTAVRSVEQLPPTSTTSSTSTSTRNAGKASKTSTPTTATFPTESAPRSRSSRATIDPLAVVAPAPAKRSHKKGAGAAARQLANAISNAHTNARLHPSSTLNNHEDDAGSSIAADDEEDEDDDSEPRYCYCNQVSYGEMVACDAEDCPREWFHLDCVGLTKAPKGNAKWYCDECKELLKRGKHSTTTAGSTPATAR